MRLTASRNRTRTALKRRHIDGRGQSIVEFMLAVPIFLALLFGSLDIGILFKTHAAYQEATQQAVRVAAGTGGSDQSTLDELRTMLPGENLNNITSVTIYDATITGSQVTATTIPRSTSPDSTTYTYNNSTNSFVCQGKTHGPPCDPATTWDPLKERRSMNALDHIGVKVIYNYRSVTGALLPIQMTQTASAELEPTSYGS